MKHGVNLRYIVLNKAIKTEILRYRRRRFCSTPLYPPRYGAYLPNSGRLCAINVAFIFFPQDTVSCLQGVKRRNYFLEAFGAYMRVQLGSLTAFMPQQVLDIPQICSRLQKNAWRNCGVASAASQGVLYGLWPTLA